MLTTLYTERLKLRPMVENDANQVVNWRNSPHVANMSDASSQGKLTIEEHITWFRRTRTERTDYIIETRDEEKPIGSLSLVYRNPEGYSNCAELSKYIGEPSEEGKGFASEATSRWIQYAFTELGLAFLFAKTRRDNSANIKVNEKFGFVVLNHPPTELIPASDKWLIMLCKREWWLNKGGLTNSNQSVQNLL